MKNTRFYAGLLAVVGVVACGLMLVLGLALKAEGIGLPVAGGGASPGRAVAATRAAPTGALRFVTGATPTEPPPVPPATAPPPAPSAPAILPTATKTAPVLPAPTALALPPFPVAETQPGASHWATRLVIPSLGVDAPVLPAPIEGDTWKVDHLDQAVGHLERTAGPGEAGNIVLAGHITLAPDGRAGPFINLGNLTKGNKVIVYRGDRAFTYEVDYMDTVQPSDVEVTYPTEQARLTLLTCLNYDRRLEHYADRLVVVGHLLQ